MPASKKYTIRKFNGDDAYSWAVFRSADVKGKRGIIFPGEAKPLYAGMSRAEANYYRTLMEK